MLPMNLGDIAWRDDPARELIVDFRDPTSPVSWSAGRFHDAVQGVARGLRARGLAPGDRVAILSDNRPEFLAAYLGIMRAGLVAVPINFRLARDTIDFILSDAGVRTAFADAERLPLCPRGLAPIGFDEPGRGGFEGFLDAGDFPAPAPASGQVAKILYTSGSTGRPKGVPLAHDGQRWALGTCVQPGVAERTVIAAPAYHKNGLFFSMVALANGWPFASLPRFAARPYLEAVARYRCTLLTGIPTMFALLARERDLLGRLDLRSVTTVTIGSAPLTDGLVHRVLEIFPNATVTNGYGTTEAGPVVFGPHPAGLPRPPLALGYPHPDVAWRLVGGADPDQGVLELRTPALMPGYLNLPEVTAARMCDGWYHTGDVMRRDGDGFFYFVGRADDMFVCGGENVYPGEVEQLLERCPGVAQAAVVPVEDEIKGAIPVAFVVPAPGAVIAPEEVKAFALAHGPAFSHPRVVEIRSELPVAGTHKIDRSALLQAAQAAVVASGRRSPT